MPWDFGPVAPTPLKKSGSKVADPVVADKVFIYVVITQYTMLHTVESGRAGLREVTVHALVALPLGLVERPLPVLQQVPVPAARRGEAGDAGPPKY